MSQKLGNGIVVDCIFSGEGMPEMARQGDRLIFLDGAPVTKAEHLALVPEPHRSQVSASVNGTPKATAPARSVVVEDMAADPAPRRKPLPAELCTDCGKTFRPGRPIQQHRKHRHGVPVAP